MAIHPSSLPVLSFQEAIEGVWQIGLVQLRAGAKNIRLPDNIPNLIGPNGLDEIVFRFSDHIKNRAVFVHDKGARIFTIAHFQDPVVDAAGGASSMNSVDMVSDLSDSAPSGSKTASQSKGKEKTPTRKGKALIPRPPNAFILYRQHYHASFKALYPDMHNNQISLLIGRQWRNEAEEARLLFREKAAEVKDQHMKDHPDYQYRPRKPSEKQRRMTKKKAEAIASDSSVSVGLPPYDPEENIIRSGLASALRTGIFTRIGNNGNPIPRATLQGSTATPPIPTSVAGQSTSPNFPVNNLVGPLGPTANHTPYSAPMAALNAHPMQQAAIPSWSTTIDANGWTGTAETAYYQQVENQQWAACCRMDELEEEFTMLNTELEVDEVDGVDLLINED